MNQLPDQIHAYLQNHTLIPVSLGCSVAKVWRAVPKDSNSHIYYLKMNSLLYREELYHEYEILSWLKDRLPVPKVISYLQTEQDDYLLTTEIAGVPACDVSLLHDPLKLTELLASSLKLIHSLPIENCPFLETNVIKLRKAQDYIRCGKIPNILLSPKGDQRFTQDILDALQRIVLRSEDLVFTHGDYCLPNVLFQDNKLSGFVIFNSNIIRIWIL